METDAMASGVVPHDAGGAPAAAAPQEERAASPSQPPASLREHLAELTAACSNPTNAHTMLTMALTKEVSSVAEALHGIATVTIVATHALDARSFLAVLPACAAFFERAVTVLSSSARDPGHAQHVDMIHGVVVQYSRKLAVCTGHDALPDTARWATSITLSLHQLVGHPTVFTPVHTHLVLCASRSRQLDVVVPILLAAKCTGIAKTHPSVTSAELLTFLNLAGSMLAVKRHFREAQWYFRACSHVPMGGEVSTLEVRAFASWLLLCLLLDGEVGRPNKLLLARLGSAQAPKVKAYTELADHFTDSSPEVFNAHVAEHASVWATDGVWKLVQEVQHSAIAWRIVKASKIYSALPAAHLAKIAGLPNTEDAAAAVASLAAAGRVDASVVRTTTTGTQPIVHFTTSRCSPVDARATVSAAELMVKTAEVSALVTKLHAVQSSSKTTALRTTSMGVVLDRVNPFNEASSAAMLAAAAEAVRASPEDDLLHAQLLLSLSTDLLTKARHTTASSTHRGSRAVQSAAELFGGSAIVGS